MSLRERYRQSGRINVYLEACALVARRLRWDVDPRSWISRSRLRARRNRYAGHKAVILCNGPSLNRVDFDLLQDTFTFGLNKINLLFDRVDFRPNCVVSVNPYVIAQNRQFFSQTDIPLFLDSDAAGEIPFRKNVTFLHTTGTPGRVAADCSMSVAQGYTVTAVALQLALHMGFDAVGLVGCDHSFAAKGQPNKVVSSDERDANHFDERYFSGGMPWQLPDLVASEYYYSRLALAFYERGRKIVNCTDGGKLDLFERQSLRDFLAA